MQSDISLHESPPFVTGIMYMTYIKVYGILNSGQTLSTYHIKVVLKILND